MEVAQVSRSIKKGGESRSIEEQPRLNFSVSEEVAAPRGDSSASKEAQLEKVPKRPKVHAQTFPRKARYTTHHARSDVGKKITKLIDRIASEEDFVSTIGWTDDERGEMMTDEAMIIADPPRYREMSREASKLLKGTESQKGDFAYSSLRVMKGNLLADLIDKESRGKKILWSWAAAGSSVFMKMDGSRYFNIHSALIEWEGVPNIRFKSSSGDLHGILDCGPDKKDSGPQHPAFA